MMDMPPLEFIRVTPSPFMRSVVGAALADDHARLAELTARHSTPRDSEMVPCEHLMCPPDCPGWVFMDVPLP